MARTLIIGYGNPLRGDDRLGWCVAERLRDLPEIAGDLETEIIACHQLTPELAEPVSRAELVIFIDAAEAGIPGDLRCERVEAEGREPDALGHHFTPARVLAYALALFGAKPKALIFSVVAASFEPGEHLSPVVEAAIPEVVAQIRHRIL